MTVRLSVNINEETEEALRELAKRRQTTVTEIVRRAVGVYKYVDDEVIEPKKVLQIATADGEVERELVLL